MRSVTALLHLRHGHAALDCGAGTDGVKPALDVGKILQLGAMHFIAGHPGVGSDVGDGIVGGKKLRSKLLVSMDINRMDFVGGGYTKAS